MRDLLGQERMKIRLGGEEAHAIERAEVRLSFFTQPGTFAARVGHSRILRELLDRTPPGTAYELLVSMPDGREVRIMSGRLDDANSEGGSGGTEATLKGRDWMMPLHDGHPSVERTFGQITFTRLTEEVIKLSGVDEPTLFFDNEDNRLAVQGTPKTETVKATTREFAIEEATAARVGIVSSGEAQGSPFAYDVIPGSPERFVALPDTTEEVKRVVGIDVPNPLKLSLGTTFLHFLQQEHNRAGLFLFAGAEPRSYVLTRPSVLQPPRWGVLRRRGASWGIVAPPDYTNATAGRFSHYTVRGRGGGGKDGKKQIEGTFIDPEMVKYGLIKHWAAEDKTAKTSKAADYLARRMWAEKSRAGWTYRLPVKGLSWPTLGGEYAVWSPDGMIDLKDEEIGLEGPHWISEVAMSFSANGATTSHVTLHRPAHLVFGDEVLPERKGKKK